MSIKLIAVDMDGTFLSDQKTYNRERFMAQYQQMKAQGIRFVVASGNQYYQLISFFPEIANEIAFVAENGGWVVSEGKDVFNGELSKDAFATVVEHLLTRPEVEIIACGKNSAYTLKKYDDAMKTVAEMYYHRLEYVDNFDNLEDIFFKFGLNLSDELIPQVQKALHEAIGDIMVSVHTGNGSIAKWWSLAMAVTILRCCVRQALVLQWKMPVARSSQRQNTGQAPITVKAYWM